MQRKVFYLCLASFILIATACKKSSPADNVMAPTIPVNFTGTYSGTLANVTPPTTANLVQTGSTLTGTLVSATGGTLTISGPITGNIATVTSSNGTCTTSGTVNINALSGLNITIILTYNSGCTLPAGTVVSGTLNKSGF